MKRIVTGCLACAAALLPAAAAAQETMVLESVGRGRWGVAAIALSAGIAIAVAALGGAIGQGRVAAAAMEGISRNPEAASKVMTPMIIALALIESLVIYALVVAFLLQGKI